MDYETHSILHSSPDEVGGWSGCIDENWIVELVTDVHGRVREARIWKNDVEWVAPCDDGNDCRCTGPAALGEVYCPFTIPEQSSSSTTFVGSIGDPSGYQNTGGMRPTDVIEAFNMTGHDQEDDRIVALLNRPWAYATETEIQEIFDGEDTECHLVLPTFA